MSFDFGALAQMKKDIDSKEEYHTKVPKAKKSTKLKKEKVEDVSIEVANETEVEVVNTGKIKDKSIDDKLDEWIEQYKGQPKVMYDDLGLLCTYEEDTETVYILNKYTGELVSFISKEFFEYAVFKTNTRPEKAQVIRNKYTEMTGNSIVKVELEDSKEEVTEEVVEEVTEEEFVTPDID